MKLRLHKLDITFKKSVETIPFTDFNYFYGEMGAGKSTIARLVDYCLGAKQLVMTPCLQGEFVAVALSLTVDGKDLRIERGRDSSNVVAAWGDEQLMLPARDAGGVVIPDTEVEVLSDLVFHIQGKSPPRVRRSQLNEDSDLERLSLRDLLFYCYLDQDSMDSSFFYLDREAETFRRLKSRNVLRTVLGVHQERVAELELRLDEVRRERARFLESADVLATTMEETGIASEIDADVRIKELKTQLTQIVKRSEDVRRRKQNLQGHAADRLRDRARQLTDELEATAVTLEQLDQSQDDDTRHLNEILALSTKVRRLESARAVLNGVSFQRCPRCTQTLPNRSTPDCPVCGQPDAETSETTTANGESVEADMDSRIKELQEVLKAQSVQMKRVKRREGDLRKAKEGVDAELIEVLQRYDSAFLAEALSIETEKAEAEQEIKYVEKLKALPKRVDSLRQKAGAAAAEEVEIREQLRTLREAAEKDLGNLNKLKTLFLDCLVRAKISGFSDEDVVNMKQPWFLPEILGSQSGDLAVSSFSNLGSGGKKNLFKCCFALALHRLANELNTLLPSILIIDSPMKNISERENRKQFEGFHKLLYDLATTELKGTQFILIDKEFCPPPVVLAINLKSRHMRVNSKEFPPLCPYFIDRGEEDHPEPEHDAHT